MPDLKCYECGGTPEECECEDGPIMCECVRVDVDLEDNRNCPAHGPRSASARRQLQQEADDNFAYYATWPKDLFETTDEGAPF
jgi:hypothetical protein